MPEAIGKLIQRYAFVKFPTAEDLTKDKQIFSMGKFRDVQIQEMGIYGDGVIVSSRSDTDILDAFIDELFAWIRSEFGLVPVVTAKPEKHYESSLVVKADVDMVQAIKPASDVADAFNEVWRKDYFDVDFKPASFILDCDPQAFSGRRKPFHFGVERRLGVPFDENVFFSQAPLKTKDHLAFLARVEDLARPG